MKQRGNRSGTFHGIRKPDMKGQLRGFSHCAAEHQDTGDVQIEALRFEQGNFGKNLAENDRTGGMPKHENAEHESKVADPIDDEGLLARFGGRSPAVIMSNQDIGADADQLPKDEHHDKVVRQDDAEHREEEKRQPGEVTPIALFMSHVADRVDEDQGSNRIDHDKHRPAERIDDHPNGNGEDVANVDPRNLIRCDVAWLKEEPPAKRR